MCLLPSPRYNHCLSWNIFETSVAFKVLTFPYYCNLKNRYCKWSHLIKISRANVLSKVLLAESQQTNKLFRDQFLESEFPIIPGGGKSYLCTLGLVQNHASRCTFSWVNDDSQHLNDNSTSPREARELENIPSSTKLCHLKTKTRACGYGVKILYCQMHSSP